MPRGSLIWLRACTACTRTDGWACCSAPISGSTAAWPSATNRVSASTRQVSLSAVRRGMRISGRTCSVIIPPEGSSWHVSPRSYSVIGNMEGIKEIAAIGRSELLRMLRSARALVLLGLYSMFSLLVLLIVGSIGKAVRASVSSQVGQLGSDAAAQQAFAQLRTGILGFFFSDDPAVLEALKEIPLVVLIVFKVTLVFLPAYVAL